MDKAVVILSGGMDSSTALYWAAERYEIARVVNFDYGQKGAEFEMRAASLVLEALKAKQAMDLKRAKREIKPTINPQLQVTPINIIMPPVFSALTHECGDGALKREARDRYDQPMTFVPGRNLIFISYATALAYDSNSEYIIGGWSGMDVEYPDCRPNFLDAVSVAASSAIGRVPCRLFVKSPVVGLTKAETVSMGVKLEVPWGITRSCYTDQQEPCLVCDSCRVRLEAFFKAGVRDPLVVDDHVWDKHLDAFMQELRTNVRGWA